MAQKKLKSKSRHLKVDQITEAKYSNIDNDITLDLPDIETINFPFVTVVTITRNRGYMFGITVYNWMQTIYPENRIEWLVLDDGDEDLTSVFPDDNRIRYVKCEKMDIGEKRNKAVDLAKHNYIVHMDDDGYYFPHSILARIRVMLHYNKQCVYSHNLGVYDMITKTSNTLKQYTYVPELTMAYTRQFWETRKFGKAPYESFQLVKKREKDIVKLPFWFNVIIFTDKSDNYTHLKIVPKTKFTNVTHIDDMFSPEFKQILERTIKRLPIN